MFILHIAIHIVLVCDVRYAEQSSGDLIEIRCAFIDATGVTPCITAHCTVHRQNPILT